MLLQFQDAIRYNDARLSAPTCDRAIALDQWITESIGDPWLELKACWALPALDRCPPRSLSGFFLAATEVVRISTAAGGDLFAKRDAVVALARSVPQKFASILLPQGGSIDLPKDHPTVRADLRTVAHPAIQGVTLSGFGEGDSLAGVEVVLSDALKLISDSCPAGMELVATHCGAICLLRATPALATGGCVSLTSKLIPGLIYLTPVPTILSAESIVHESAHLCLTCRERVSELYLDTTCRFKTPLRPDPRPVSGLLHQAWVLLHLVHLYDGMLENRSPVVLHNEDRVRQRRELHASGLEQGLSVLNDARSALTADGIELFSRLLSAAVIT
ncbi:MAG: hypothetical protein EXS10_07195 [Phycisphaerales bacterium]|nr:hypothetical protein [Phycisphaerales bacterium]